MTFGGGSVVGRPSTDSELAPSSRRERRRTGDSARRHSGHRQQASLQLLVKRDPLVTRRIGLGRQSNGCGNRIRRLHVAVERIEIEEPSGGQSGAVQERQRHGELPDEQRVGPAPHLRRRAQTTAFLESLGGRATRGIDRRRQAEEPRGDERDGRQRRQQADVHLDAPIRQLRGGLRRRERQGQP